MKIGDLVRKYSCSRLGIVIETARNTAGRVGHIKVRWDADYGTFWTSTKAVEVLSENR